MSRRRATSRAGCAKLLAQRFSPASIVSLLLVATAVPAAAAAELKPHTVAAFDRYVRATEARMAGELADPRRFLAPDALPDARRAAALERLRHGELFIERLETRDGGKAIDVPDGMIHHWVGVVFVPGADVDEVLALLQDYNRHAEIYEPAVQRSKLLARQGDTFRVFLRFSMTKIITVVTNTEHEARFTRLAPDRAHSRIYSTRIAEVENASTTNEREKPVGRDGGYLWRLYTYWRFLARDGGVYVQCESITLTRDIPFGFGWLVGPFVTSIPRESLTFTLERTRKTLAERRRSAPHMNQSGRPTVGTPDAPTGTVAGPVGARTQARLAAILAESTQTSGHIRSGHAGGRGGEVSMFAQDFQSPDRASCHPARHRRSLRTLLRRRPSRKAAIVATRASLRS